jgi:hypothetical protein
MQLFVPIKPKFKTEQIIKNQTVEDIVKQIKRAIKESEQSAVLIAPKLKGSTKLHTLLNVFNFVKKIPYKKESSDQQTARTLNRILHGAINGIGGDCKHYSIAISSLLNALNIPHKLRLISQNFYNSEPTHIYVVAYINGKEVILDPVMKNFNDEAQYKYKYDI